MKKRHDSIISISETGQDEFNFGYFYRTVEEHINAYATQPGNPHSVTQIAFRVAKLLEAKALREEYGNPELVPEVRKDSSSVVDRGKEKSSLRVKRPKKNLHVGTRRGRALSEKGRAAISRAQKKRWARYLTPEQRDEHRRKKQREWYARNRARLAQKAREQYAKKQQEKVA